MITSGETLGFQSTVVIDIQLEGSHVEENITIKIYTWHLCLENIKPVNLVLGPCYGLLVLLIGCHGNSVVL